MMINGKDIDPDIFVYEYMLERKIPRHVPNEFDIEKEFYQKGVIRSKDLEHGKYYLGTCRNASIARWDDNKKVFKYMRNKFNSWYSEDINYLDNDNGYDLYIAVKEIDESDVPDHLKIINLD